MERQRVRQASYLARDDGDGTELTHRARVAEDDAVEQPPLDVRQCHAQKNLEAARAQHARGFFLLGSRRFHYWNDLSRDERKRDENRRQNDSGNREHDLEPVIHHPRAKQALPSEQQDEYYF